MKNSKITFIVRTGVLIAILLIFQITTKSFGTILTGSLVNLVLVLASLLGGVWAGLIVAVLSPFLATFFGIVPGGLIQIVPIIAIGNTVLVLVYALIAKKSDTTLSRVISVILASVLKFAVLYVGVCKILLSVLPSLPDQKITAITVAFSWPQLITALIGGTLACSLYPVIKKGLKL